MSDSEQTNLYCNSAQTLPLLHAHSPLLCLHRVDGIFFLHHHLLIRIHLVPPKLPKVHINDEAQDLHIISQPSSSVANTNLLSCRRHSLLVTLLSRSASIINPSLPKIPWLLPHVREALAPHLVLRIVGIALDGHEGGEGTARL
jgi:hypothetical protein